MIRLSAPLLAVLMAFSFSVPAHSKCACLLITIEVDVRGQAKSEQSVMADIDPGSFWSVQLAGDSPNNLSSRSPSTHTPVMGFSFRTAASECRGPSL